MIISGAAIGAALVYHYSDDGGSDLPGFTVNGDTDLPGNFFISFVYSKNIMMLDGHGNVVWSKHEDQKDDNVHAGFWDFKKHTVGGKTYYSYHDQDSSCDKFGLEGFAPGDRVILDENFNEVKRIRFEQSSVVEKGHPLDGHDFFLFDLDHYIMSGYIRDTVTNVPGYAQSTVIYSYLQEVDHGTVVWEWKSIDYPELYGMVCTEATPNANDFGNVTTAAPDYVHFNAMRVNDDGNLVCSFRHLDTILFLDRSKSTDQIIWRLSGPHDEFHLADDQKTSGQHYVTVSGNQIMVFDNHNIDKHTHIHTFDLDTGGMTAASTLYTVDGKFSSACGSVTRVSGDLFCIGWGRSENDSVCMSVYDFAQNRELLSVTLEDRNNFTYRCVYYE
ncbi:hypothetical protein TALC_00516 [Thermoplasmatales archaeon BRNA1]|nr:hypothetical protein TALC_00516 [Thermoplasmatales archaeon BRNA1]